MSEHHDHDDLERRVALLEEQVRQHRDALRAVARALADVDGRLDPGAPALRGDGASSVIRR